MAPRLSQNENPFWIIRELPRRGIIGGFYDVEGEFVNEIMVPHLLRDPSKAFPYVEAEDDVKDDVMRLLNLLKNACFQTDDLSWKSVLPIYPTSPIRRI